MSNQEPAKPLPPAIGMSANVIPQKTSAGSAREQGLFFNKLKLNLYDCLTKQWTGQSIEVRNTLFAFLHGQARAAIGVIPVRDPKPKPEMLADFEGLKLDFAASSRTHGHFIFTDSNVGALYYGDKNSMGRIIYGSMLMTENRALYLVRLNILVLDEKSEEGQKVGLGDSHGKIKPSLLAEFKTVNPNWKKEPDLEGEDININQFNKRDVTVPVQFRAAILDDVIAKGTVVADDRVTGDIHLVLPQSCFKAKVPEHGQMKWGVYLVFAVVHEAKSKPAKGGQMLWQWYSWESVAHDVMGPTIAEAEKLSKATDSIRDLAAVLNIEDELQMDDDFAVSVSSDAVEDYETQGNADRYRDPLLEIITADKYGQLTGHPYIVSRLKDRLRKRWLRLALNGAVRFRYLLGLPLEELDDDTFLAPQLPKGECIVFRNPIRHWGDIQIWRNVTKIVNKRGRKYKPKETVYKNTAWMNTVTAKKVGGDFDGDLFNFEGISKFKKIAAETKTFANDDKYGKSLKNTNIQKPGKNRIEGSLAEVAVRSLDSKVGIVAKLIMRAQATNTIAYAIEINNWDYNTGQTTGGTQEVTILEFLSYELQIAVDRLKNQYFHNMTAINQAREIIMQEKQPSWIDDYKSEDVYKERLMNVLYLDNKELPPDTVSKMINEVNAWWRPLEQKMQNVSVYANFFPTIYIGKKPENNNAPHTVEMLNMARKLNIQYAQKTVEAINVDTKTREGQVKKQKLFEQISRNVELWISTIKNACELADKTYKQGIPLNVYENSTLQWGVKLTDEDTLVPASVYDWVCAFWDACHAPWAKDESTGGLVFRMYPDEIIKNLGNPAITQAKLYDCMNKELKAVIWGNPNAKPKIDEKGEAHPYLAEPNPENPYNKFRMKPMSTTNLVELMFVDTGEEDEGGKPVINALVRSNEGKPWKEVGIVFLKTQKEPPLNKVLVARLYTDQARMPRENKIILSKTIIAIWQN